jgi:hypothetical protein
MRLVFMVEERSMKEVLERLLPRILPTNLEHPLIIAHNGKSDLVASIPKKLRAWQNADDKFIIVHDQDSNDCIYLKSELLALCANSRNDYLVRIACKELESWYFGDLNAVSLAYGKDFRNLANKRKYRVPDAIANAKEEIYKLIPSHQQISGAQKIAQYMDADNNTSHSFNVFVDGVKRMVVC